MEINTVVSVAEPRGRALAGNITLEDAKFFGRPNFAGAPDAFKDSRRKFTVLIPLEVAEQLKKIGWNVKVTEPQNDEQTPLAHMKVMVDFSTNPETGQERGPDIWVIKGEKREKLDSKTAPILDRSRIIKMDMEIRGWEYDPEDNPGQLSARLVALIVTLEPNLLLDKYGI